MSAARPRLGLMLGLTAVAGLALAVRVAAGGEALATGAFVPSDGDSLYHLRRMAMTAADLPRVPGVDPWLAWPDGGRVQWSPGFDLAGAVALRLGQAVGGPSGGWLAAALLHLGLGVLVVLLAVELTHAVAPASPARGPAALAAGLLAALLPQAVASTRLGIVDHHVLETLTLLLLGRFALVVDPDAACPAPSRWRTEIVAALLAASGVLVFAGAPLYVALVMPLLLGAALAAPRPALIGSGAPGLAVGAALAAAGTAPLVAQHGHAFDYGFASYLQPTLVAAAAAALGLAVVVARRLPGQRWPARCVAWLLLGLAAGGAALLLVPRLAAEGRAGLVGWLLRRDPWLARIDEFQPMVRATATGTAVAVWRYLGTPGALLPLSLFAWVARRPRGRRLGLAWLVGSSWALALLQNRFGRVAVPWVALSAGMALLAATDALIAWRPGQARWLAWAPAAAAALLALLDPALASALRPEPAGPDAGVEVGLDLAGWDVVQGAEGVLAPWDLGNQVLTLGGRPVVANGMGSYPDPRAFEDSERAFQVGEAELLGIARARRVGAVVAGATNLFGRVRSARAGLPFSGAGFNPAWLTSVPSAPLLLGGAGIPSLGVRHFEHLMPRFASSFAVIGIDRPLPVLWGYEIVRGARLEGLAPPGARAVLEVPLEEHGRPHTWRAFADAGPDGRWTMTVPLPTDLATPTVRTTEGRLRVGDGPALPLAVPEAAVRAGQPVAVAPAPR
ncbi:MAG TPA: hypothetical protein VFP50_14655 [Anaeromyxobacteraceae bacterium]|nr:hypothetical protein [Anaeromyxobacteraceae bacterium]